MVDAQGGIIMCKLKGWMQKGGHYDVQMKRWIQKGGIKMCKLKGWIDKGGHYVKIKRCFQRGHYDVQIQRADEKGRALLCGNERVDATGGNMMCKLKGRMDKGRHYDVEMKGWLQ